MSAINEEHPDATAEDFFGGGEDGALERDPGDFDPDPPDDPGPTEPRTVEERGEDAYQYARAHGEPVTQGMEDKHQAFMGAVDAPEEIPDPLLTQAKLKAIAEREAAEKLAAESEVKLDGKTIEPEVGTTEPKPAFVPDTPAEPAADEKKPPSGDLSREYIVFQKVPLTVKVLEHLLAQAKDGDAPEPSVAWIEIDRAEARNVNGAVGTVYTAHQKQLGKKVDLAAVSSRAFQTKHVEPKEVVETNLSIT